MTDKKKTSEEPAPQGHHHDELAEVKQFIETYGKPAVTALLVVMIAIGAFQMYTTRKQNRIDESARQLAAARSIPDFEAVYANYGKTKAAPRALLAAAKLYYDNANYEIAIAKYEEFLREFPEDRMVSTAELGRIDRGSLCCLRCLCRGQPGQLPCATGHLRPGPLPGAAWETR